MVTPFTKNGVDLEAFGEMMEYQIAGGVSALVVLGTTGEPATMTDDEKLSLAEYAVKKAGKRVKIILGTGSNCTEKAVSMSKTARKIGADAVLAVTPYYNKCTQNGLYLYYKTIAEATDLPMICYNVPARTGVNILPETMGKIADIPNIAGIKEASGNMAQVLETARLIAGKCDLYSGEDALNLPILACGGTAVISVLSNLVPAEVNEMCNAVAHGDLKKARAINDRLLPLAKACFIEVNPIPVKEGLNLLGFCAGKPRAPLTPLEEIHREALKTAMTACGLEVRA